MATIVIKVNLVDLTDIIIFTDARFDSRVNGEPGSCEFRVRDDNNDLVFESGQSITVDIDADRVWTGYLMQATSTYIFPAGPLPTEVPRIWRITGVDINILFRRRIVVDPDDPTVMTGKTYKYTGTPTPDTTAITALVTDFLDLSGDGLDVSTLVENVGDINVDQDTNAFGASWTWEQSMASIAALPAAIYYLAPTRDLVYTDVDTVDAPFGISDQPDGVTTFGYREPELLKDASNLINEYFAWGIGTGSNDPVFSRLEDATSVTDHGRWQQASLTYDVYKQATVDRIADSWVNGSPTSRRGHKDDKIAFMCTVFEPGLQAGMKVDVTSNVFAFNDVLPIRELRLSFANQTDPIYRLTLSHAIDAPWSFYQMFNPSIPRLAWDDQFVAIRPEPELFVAGGDSGKVATSPNGVTWTQRESGFGASAILAATYSPFLDLFVIAGASGKLATSPDGIEWTLQTSSFGTSPVFGVAWSPEVGLFVACGDDSKLATSSDGVTWTQRTSPFDPFPFGGDVIRAVSWSPQVALFVVVGDIDQDDFVIATSPNGLTWTTRTGGETGQNTYQGASWSPEIGLFAIVSNGGRLATSPNGITWTDRTSSFGSTPIHGVVGGYDRGFGLLVAVGNTGKLATSFDGIDWGQQAAGFGTTPIRGVDCSTNLQLFVIVGDDGKLATSPDAFSFTIQTSSFDTTDINCVVARDRNDETGVGWTDGTDTFDLSGPFWKGTSRAWLDGEAQELGVDYDEDYDGGFITFTSLPAQGLEVVVTRVQRTPLGGGASRRLI